MDKTKRCVWGIILGCSLGVSGWSLWWIARHLGAPMIVAVAAPLTLDGVALLCASYALEYVRKGYSGSLARAGVLLFAGGAAYVNSMHAVLAHQGNFVRVLWAIPSLGAVLVYEVHARLEKAQALARANRVTPPLPSMGVLSWVLFPVKSYRAIRRLIAYQRGQMLQRYAPGAFRPVSGGEGESSQARSQSFGEAQESSGELTETFSEVSIVPTAIIRKWARGRGIPVNDRGGLSQDVISMYYKAEGGNFDEQSG